MARNNYLVLGTVIFVNELNAAACGATRRKDLVPDLELDPAILALLRRLNDEASDVYGPCRGGQRRC
ncbi:hypothetical protein GCM10023176_31440 [Micromonospora coerulea]|uniref:Uncharacterized protein n=1 Tax=Micromonospora coerulea TaxID=47856 RepID=A0ABP8SMM1_9ACTN